MSTSVKHITSTMRGAPAINGLAGTLISVLDALLTTGWGGVTPLSVSVSGGVATATFSPGESFTRDSVVLVAGASPSSLNGEARVLTATNTSATWATTAPDGVATGAVSIKYAPQSDWVKVYSGTNKAVYKSVHAQSLGHFLRVDDTGGVSARVRGYESMTDVDTGSGPFPTDAQISGGGHWVKSAMPNASGVVYQIFCDERFVLLCVSPGSYSSGVFNTSPARGFGDLIALAPAGDGWASALSANTSAGGSSVDAGSFVTGQLSNTYHGVIACPKSIGGLGGSVLLNPAPWTGSYSVISGADSYLGTVPSSVDGRVRPSRMFVRETATGSPPRAEVPGGYYLPHSGVFGVLAGGDVLTGAGELAGRRFSVIPCGASYGGASGAYLVDITGPWR